MSHNQINNHVQLGGTVRQDPYIIQDESPCRVSLDIMVPDSFRNREGEYVDFVHVQRVQAYGRIAQAIRYQVKGGMKIIIRGRITNQSRMQGEEKIITREIIVTEFQILSEKQVSENQSDEEEYQYINEDY